MGITLLVQANMENGLSSRVTLSLTGHTMLVLALNPASLLTLPMTKEKRKPSFTIITEILPKQTLRTMKISWAPARDWMIERRNNDICEQQGYNRLISDYWVMSAPTTQHRLTVG